MRIAIIIGAGAAVLLAGCGAAAPIAGSALSSSTTTTISTATVTAEKATAAPTAVPTQRPTPAPTAVPTADPAIAEGQLYASTVIRDSQTVGADFTAMGNDGSDILAIRADMVKGSSDLQTFLDDLGKITVPPILHKADSLLRQSLSTMLAGLQLGIQGIDDSSPSEVNSATQQIIVANGLLASATAEVKRVTATL